MSDKKKSVIGVYAKWLNEIGGGERVATVIAETLASKGSRVDLISNFEVKKEDVEKKLGVNLKNVDLVHWNELAYDELEPRTEKYDLFINTSYLDHLPSKAKKSVYYVHFPTPIRRTILGFVKYETVLPFLRKFLIIPRIVSGMRNVDEINARSGKWLSNNTTIVISNIPSKAIVKFRIFVSSLDINSLKNISFFSETAKIEVLDSFIEHKQNILVYIVGLEAFQKTTKITLKTNYNIEKNPSGLVSMTVNNFRFVVWNFFKKYLPSYEMALYGSSSYKPAKGLDSYQLFLSNSKFTQKWVRNYWGKESKVLYPPVDITSFKPTHKENIILNVGRFFTEGHSKKQEILVSEFKKLVDAGKLSGWQLVLVGSVGGRWEDQEYYEGIVKSAKGYPIKIYTTLDFAALKTLFGKATLYWHATGYQTNEPIEKEHFGITVVEAMAAGCVPLVFHGGGLVEIVGENNNLTWKTNSELAELTLNLIKDKKTMSQLGVKMRNKANSFSKANFISKLEKFI